MRIHSSSIAVAATLLALLAMPAYAQYGAKPISGSPEPLGENYRVEAQVGLWGPTPDIVVSSSALGRIGSTISAVDDLGINKKQLPDLRFVLKPGRKHKFRIAYLPASWTADKIVTRDIEFNAQLFRVSLPVQSEVEWKEWSFGYEYDFVSNNKGFGGLFVDLKYPTVNVTLTSLAVGTEFTQAKAPVPTIGGVGRIYATPIIAVNFELTLLKIPQIENYKASFIDWDLAGLFNVNKNFAARVGFRSMNVNYVFDLDTGDMKLRGLYFAGVARF
ncbi:MAG: hypothetical protein ACM36C_11115 [Acidobacteriota bacterium]